MKNKYLLTIALLLSIFSWATADGQNCAAGFSFGETNITIQFTDQSTSSQGDPIVSWLWDFGDGETSALPNPLHTFPEAEDYLVCLQITTQSGCTDQICMEIDICILQVTVSTGNCNGNNQIPITIHVADPYDRAKNINIYLDNVLVPGSPFEIDDIAPVTVNATVPGDGLEHTVFVQSDDVGTCSTLVSFSVSDCTSDCFLSSMNVAATGGTTHVVQVGDNFFSPVNTTIIVGDVTEFQWVGDGHSTTSDATSGPDSWNSGVIGFGSVYPVNITNPGVHPFYCIPHGNPGGVGMSGTIIANCPTDNQIDLIINFNTSVTNPAGYNVLLDGTNYPGSPFAYNGTGPQSVSMTLAGDGTNHVIEIQDVSDPTCTLSRNYLAPDCGATPTCSLSLSVGQIGGCNAANNVNIEMTLNSINAGASGFNILIDGSLASGSPFSYNGSGITIVNIPVVGDGQSHVIEAHDLEDPGCTATANLITQNCTIPCQLTNLVANTGSTTIQLIEVRDFEFVPQHITITAGDIIEWQWTGAIAHTSTSDVGSGPDSWNSGLLDQGATYQSPVLSAGIHPYYCIPHGAPGGVGMSGTITVQADCTNGQVSVGLTFTEQGGGFGGYEVLVDGNVAGSFNYDPSGNNSASVSAPGDGQSHTIIVQDIDDPGCSISTSVNTPDCNASTCQLELDAQEETGCNNNQVTVQLTITDIGGGTGGFEVFVDGNSAGTFAYSGTGSTLISQTLPGDGQNHLIEIQDIDSPGCEASRNILSPDCTVPCALSALTINTGGAGDPVIHTVEVIDFAFEPAILNIQLGDVVRFVWTGVIAHTTTSDAGSGPNSWDSGLLTQGASYEVTPTSLGEHPYYCIPHGAPGGVGMSGVIVVKPACDSGNYDFAVNFSSAGTGDSGFEVLIDGELTADSPYNYATTGENSQVLSIPGDGASHNLIIRDVEAPDCSVSGTFEVPNCEVAGPCSLNFSATQIAGCNENGELTYQLNITAENTSPSGFNIRIDDLLYPGSPFAYGVAGDTTLEIIVGGIGTDRMITLQDIDSTGCQASQVITTPQCGPECEVLDFTIHAVEPCSNGFAQIMISFSITNGSNFGYNLFLDGEQLAGPIAYDDPMGLNTHQITIPGDTAEHILRIEDLEIELCSASLSLMAPDCTPDCDFSNLQLTIGGPQVHVVEVLDFEFQPKDLTVNVGDIIRWEWIGVVPHTVTSDATSGNSVWNSGLLGQGAVYEVTITEEGMHPYYCIPHGGPGGIGMAGTINAVEDCADGVLTLNFTFDKPDGGIDGYNVLVDGAMTPESPYAFSNNGLNQFTLMLPGEGQSIQLSLQDAGMPECVLDTLLLIPDCEDPCFGFAADFTAGINHLTYEVSFNNLSLNAVTWEWDFGNGDGVQVENPNYTYAEAGSYEVCLLITNEIGCSSNYCETILVGEYLCQAAFSLQTEGLTLTFTDESITTDNISQWSWDFGDLSNSLDEQHPIHHFDTLGIYEICLEIEAGACMADTCIAVDLSNPCLLFQAGFAYSINEANLSVQFTDATSATAHQWLWGFGDGFTSNEQHPLHFYDAPGDYTICLLVQDTTLGCNRSHCEVIRVGSPGTRTLDIRNKDLWVYPNPASSSNIHWTIEGLQVRDFGKRLNLKLYNVQGKTILKDQILGRKSMSLGINQALSSGLYFLEIRSDQVFYRGKLMIL